MTDTDELGALSEPSAPPDPLAEPDPAAPYGRDPKDGVLLDRNGKRAPHGLTKSGQRKHHPGRKGGLNRTAQRRPSPPSGRTITTKRRNGLVQLTEIPKGVLLGLGYKTDNTALLADAVTIDMHAEPLAAAVAQVAEENDRLGAVIDRIIEVGPLAQVGMVAGAMLAQIARNHQAIPDPVASMLGGSVEPEALAAAAKGEMERAMSNGQESAPSPA